MTFGTKLSFLMAQDTKTPSGKRKKFSLCAYLATFHFLKTRWSWQISMSTELNESTDYYELLGCDENATMNELKKAYRKAAMKWHPDRNHGNVEEATRVFQLIEHAYSILSDEHERAWYDGHRNLVQDEDGTFKATKVDIMGLFHACAYIGFKEGPRGFYNVFRKAFSTLAEEEKASAPGFGTEDSPWEDVAAFYDYWMCFTTKRSFAFAEKYRLNDAPNAMYRRAMKQDNEKAKHKAEQEFVASVRELAQYVRKRDPRVQRHIQEMERQKEERRAEEERKRAERNQKILEEIEQGRGEIEYKDEDLVYVRQFDDSRDDTDRWNCPFCKNKIRNESAFRQHCKTKKHKKNVANEKRLFMQDPNKYEHTAFNFVLLDMNEIDIEKMTGIADFDLSRFDEPEAEEEPAKKEEEEEEEEVIEKPKKQQPMSKKEKRRQQRKQMQAKKAQEKDSDDEEVQGFVLSDDEDEEKLKKINSTAHLSKKEKKRLMVQEEKERRQEQMKAQAEAKRQMKIEKNEKRGKKGKDAPKPETEEAPPAAEADDGQPKRVFAPKGMKNPPPGQFMCRKCRELFPSKRKLFAHLEATNHATAY